MNNICSCRRIALAMERDIHYMWLSGSQYPPFSTTNRFRSEHIKDCVKRVCQKSILESFTPFLFFACFWISKNIY
ncbi:MAG: transposase [Dysgonamonadaceae bacterium]|nr:transposase [Dysgonamonadaceae bacterium]